MDGQSVSTKPVALDPSEGYCEPIRCLLLSQGADMKRRQFLGALGGAAAWPFAARAQQASKLPTIGVLGTNAAIWRPWTDVFNEGLRELGWIQGGTVEIEYRYTEGSTGRLAEVVAEFVRLKVDVIVTTGTAALTVKQATSTIPIIFAVATDPIGSGLVESLARPGGNVTGLSVQSPDLAGKRLERLRDMVPHLRRLAVMFDVGYPSAVAEVGEVQVLARRLGIEVVAREIRQANDIAPAFETLRGQADALYVVNNALVNANRMRIITFALGARLPTIFNNRSSVRDGGLMSYGPNYSDQFRRTAELVDKILRGAKPGDIPVEQPVKFELVLNLKTANALGLTIPSRLLYTADDVIE